MKDTKEEDWVVHRIDLNIFSYQYLEYQDMLCNAPCI